MHASRQLRPSDVRHIRALADAAEAVNAMEVAPLQRRPPVPPVPPAPPSQVAASGGPVAFQVHDLVWYRGSTNKREPMWPGQVTKRDDRKREYEIDAFGDDHLYARVRAQNVGTHARAQC